MTLAGTRFLTINAAAADVSIDGVDAPFAVDEGTFASCVAIPHAGYATLQQCAEATITLAQDSVAVGYPAVNINNPETAACTTEEEINLRVVPPPTLTAAAEVGEDQAAVVDGDGTVVCLSEGNRQVVLHGIDLLEIDGTLPAVTLDGTAAPSLTLDGCEDLPVMGAEVRRCTQLTVQVPDSLAATDTAYQPVIEITNPGPAGCLDNTSDRPGLLTIAPRPDVVEVEPPITCIDDGDVEVVIRGEDFLDIDGEPAAVLFEGAVAPTSTTSEGCTDIAVGGKVVQTCTELRVTIAQSSLALGLPSVMVTNPMPAGCSDSEEGLLSIVEGPEITSAEPALVCTDDGDRALILTGTGFLNVDGALPTASFDGSLVTVTALGGCSPLTVNGLVVEQCTSLEVSISQGILAEGDTLIEVTNPDPAGCMTTNSTAVTVPPAVAILDTIPNNICEGNVGPNTAVTVNGTGFLRIDGTDFTASVDGNLIATTIDVASCAALDVEGATVESCGAFDISVDTTGMIAGTEIMVSIDNPDAPSVSGLASTCDLVSTAAFSIVPPPVVTTVVRDHVCEGIAETFTLTGTSFASGASITFTGNDSGTDYSPDSVVVVSDTEIQVTFDSGLPADTYDILVENGPGCGDVLPGGLLVDPTPFIFFVDPPVAYNGIELDVTIFTTGLTSSANTFELVDANDNVIATLVTDYPDPTRDNRILATIPPGITAGDYEIRVTSEFGCIGALPGGIAITDELLITIDAIAPSYVSPTRATAVTITADPTFDATTNVQFEEVPRVYLNPLSGGGGSAKGLRATVFVDATTVTAVIPEGMPPGPYELVVVNPSGGVGLLGDATTPAVVVTVNEPPSINAVVPASLTTNSVGSIELQGENFDDVVGISVDLICEDAGTGMTVVVNGSAPAATDTNTASATMDTSSVSAGSVCLVRVTNDDGAFFDYSALSITNSSLNLASWTAATPMVEPRRALGLEAGRPTNTSRFLYAVGGDDGVGAVLGTPKSSVEAASVDVLGDLGAWSQQVNTLPAPRTLAGIQRIGRFIYLTGGHDGTSATATAMRAEILDPLATPEIDDLDASLSVDGSEGLDGGLWYYRVAAIYPSTYESNPDGETLPG